MFTHDTIPIINQRTPNATCRFSGFHLSYNPSSADYGSDTTAIVMGDTLFFILNGNHKKVLATIATETGLQGCIDYFINHIELANPLSEHLGVINGQEQFGIAKSGLAFLGQANIDRIAQVVQALPSKL